MAEKDTRPVMVSIRCTVYNHEPYLRDCMDNGTIHEGMKVMAAGFGVGLSWGGVMLKY